jgi:uncharacterized iron-regulated protein
MPFIRPLSLFALLFLLMMQPVQAKESCNGYNIWIDPQTHQTTSAQKVLYRTSKEQIVLLGEHHDNPHHHRWQLQTIIQLYTYNPNMVLGFEMFPRAQQSILDQWVKGGLIEDDFLKEVQWEKTWGFDADLYMPIFHFARSNRIPMVALNVKRSLVRSVSQDGWDHVDDDQKEGVKRPAPASDKYKSFLKNIFAHHGIEESDPAYQTKFQNFVEAQLTWDGAMTQAINTTIETYSKKPMMVSIMGSGHLANGYGVPHQLKSLDKKSVSLIPHDIKEGCKEIQKGFADYVYLTRSFESVEK